MKRKSYLVPAAMIVLIIPVLVLAAANPKSRGKTSKSTDGNNGSSRLTAINVCDPRGQRDYLSRLRCPDGRAPRVERIGSVGPRNDPKTERENQLMMEQTLEMKKVEAGEKDFHVVDEYSAACTEVRHSIFLDMYHCGEPEPGAAPKGFTLNKK